MSKSSRHRSRERSHAVYDDVATRKTEKLRGLRSARRSYQHERRQFDHLLDDVRIPYDLYARRETTYLHNDGAVADTYVDSRPRDVLPENHNEVRDAQLPPVHTYFSKPTEVNVCVRRQQRRRVLFALRKTRKGSGRGKRHNWTEKSRIRCV